MDIQVQSYAKNLILDSDLLPILILHFEDLLWEQRRIYIRLADLKNIQKPIFWSNHVPLKHL